eukprot:6394616-Pyramimonas_sp.AAC.1
MDTRAGMGTSMDYTEGQGEESIFLMWEPITGGEERIFLIWGPITGGEERIFLMWEPITGGKSAYS